MRKLFALHAWLGLLSGVLLLLISLSGVVLVFMDEMDPVFYRTHYFHRQTGRERLSYDSLYGLILAAHPDAQNIYFRDLDYKGTDRNVLFSYGVYRNGREDYIGAAINPYTGQIVSRRSEREKLSENFFGWTLRFHYSLHGGKWGEVVVALLAITLLGSLITGTIVYRKHLWQVLCLKAKLRFTNWRILSSDLHRSVGVWALVFNLMIAATGFWMMRYVFSKSHFEAQKLQEQRLPKKLPVSIDVTLQRMQQEIPGFTPAYCNIPSDTALLECYGSMQGQWLLHTHYHSTVIASRTTGLLVERSLITKATFADKLEATVGPLHFGIYGNWLVKLLYCILGLSAPLLSITGFLMWWRKKSRQKPNTAYKNKGVKLIKITPAE